VIANDKGFAAPTEALLQQYEAASAANLYALATDTGTIPPDGKDHVDNEFFADDGNKAFFPPGGLIPKSLEKREIVLAAYIQALRLAIYQNPDAAPSARVNRPAAVPVVTYWIAGLPNFETYVALSSTGKEVHLFLVTPDPKYMPSAAYIDPIEENLWAIATNKRIGDLQALAGPGNLKPPTTIANRKCQKLVSY
jgi:hypothetical protein